MLLGRMSLVKSSIVVIPCYNEVRRLPIVTFQNFVRNESAVKFIFVNDGSADETLRVLEELHDFARDRVQICNLSENVGKAEAVRQGVLLAFESAPNYVGYWDADLATPLKAIASFSELLDRKPEVEMVFGARVQMLGRSIERSPLRHYPGRIFATAASVLLGIPIYDTQCGAKLFRVSPVVQSLFQEPFLDRWLLDVELIARLILERRGTGLVQAEEMIYEFPLDKWRDVPGSKVKPQDFVRAFAGLARIYLRYGGGRVLRYTSLKSYVL